MREQFPTLKAAISESYHPAQLIVRISVTSVNGLLVLFRHYVKAFGLKDVARYRVDLAPLSSFKFGAYKSSQYFAMAESIFQKAFGTKPPI